ncbi:MAG: DUF3793 family protein [Eubacterium sp.]|nr:DUF3793 family protein [Eubacterium sp.]
MRRKMYDYLKELDLRKIDTQLALQCAPVIAGHKVSNLLNLCGGSQAQLTEILSGTGISCLLLSVKKDRHTFLLYRRDLLEELIIQPGNRLYLKKAGLGGESLEEILDEIQTRYRDYISGRADFPHEIGVLLGYPVADVEGFVENRGKNYLCSGYWKVYDDLSEAKKRFALFDQSRERLMEQLAAVRDIRLLLAPQALLPSIAGAA